MRGCSAPMVRPSPVWLHSVTPWSACSRPREWPAGGLGAVRALHPPEGSLGRARSASPPIAQYAFLSDCESCALVAPSGAVEWLCLPRFDSPSIFGALLDRDSGLFRLGPGDVEVPAGRRYVPGTMVLETTWMTRTGWLIIRDALLAGPSHHDDDRSHTHRRSPTASD